MTVYIEDTLIENFLVSYLIVQIVFEFSKDKKSNVRIILSCIFASIVALVYPLINVNGVLLLVLKFCVGYIITLIAYNGTTLKKQMFFYVMFMFVTAIYGGINLMIYFSVYGNFSGEQKLPTILILFALMVISYFLRMCQKKLYKNKQIQNFVFDVVLTNENTTIKTKAYLDSGNILCDLDQKPIVLVNYKMFNKLNKNFDIKNILKSDLSSLKNGHFVSVKTASSKTKLIAFSIDELKIKQKEKILTFVNPTFALSKVKITGFDCDVILNGKMIGE